MVVVAIGAIYGNRIVGHFKPRNSASAAPSNSTPAERKVLFWYDAMNASHHYGKPGKAPDGMDLVPKYADDPAQAGDMSKQASSSARKILYWYDPMHPAYKASKAGIAPDCGMDLVPKYADEDAAVAAGTVKIAADRQQLIGVRTSTVTREPLMRSVRTTGQVVADETKVEHVHVKINGFIDKVYVNYIGQLVKKGQPLFTVYSPDLVATEEEYLIAKRGEKNLGKSEFKEVSQGGQALLRSARERLRLWDITEAQIKKLDETGEVSRTLTFYSPVEGFVTDRKAFPQTSVTPDMDIYQVTDLSKVWIIADVYEYEVPYVKVGQNVEMHLSYYAGKSYTGKVAYINPTVDPVTRTVKVRIECANPHYELKPQMLANVDLKINYGNQVLVPQEAVMDSGDKQYVFLVHEGGVFEPRNIQMGAKLDGKVVVLSGLKPGDTIVTSGNFLVDSESQLKSAMSEMKN
jgi:RND family efflux transporter MFP subunit